MSETHTASSIQLTVNQIELNEPNRTHYANGVRKCKIFGCDCLFNQTDSVCDLCLYMVELALVIL